MTEDLLKNFLEACYDLSMISKSQTTTQFKILVKEMYFDILCHL